MAISHGFNKTEAATSVTAPVTVNSGLQIVVGTAPVNMLDDPEAAVNTPMLVNTFKEAAAAEKLSIIAAMPAAFSPTIRSNDCAAPPTLTRNVIEAIYCGR